MKLKIQLVEGFWTTIWKEPIEIETDDYPQLEGMNQEEVMEYLNKNSGHIPVPPNEDADDWSLYDELINQDTELQKEKNNEIEIKLWSE